MTQNSREEQIVYEDRRRKIIMILRLHAALQKDIVYKTRGDVAIWERQEDGRLRRVQLLHKRVDEVVGTTEWLRKNGFSSPK